jgi:hypothetical protein
MINMPRRRNNTMKLRARGTGRTFALTTALATLLTMGAAAAPAAVPAADSRTKTAADDSQALGQALGQAEAQAKAVKSGKPVEVLNLRDERSTTVANPDGTFTLTQYVQPVRTRQNGKWTEIDTTLVQQKNGTYAPKAALSDMAFSGGGDTTFAEIVKDGHVLALNWPHKLPKPKVDGPTATYPNVLQGVDLQVTASAEGFSHVLVVKNKKAAANPELAELELPLDTTSVELEKKADGSLVVTDPGGGGTLFEAPQPLMWDSGNQSPAETVEPSASPALDDAPAEGDLAITPPDGAEVADVAVDVSAETMTLTPDQDLLTDDDTVYPVYIDPVVKTAGRSAWTMVSSYYSSTSFWKFADHEGVGRCPTDVSYLCASPNDVKRQFFAIPTGVFKGKDIISAEFAVTMVHTYSSSARSVELARVNSTGASAINSSTTWANQPSPKATLGSQSPTNPAGSCGTNQNVRFPVTSSVQQAADSGWDTTTFRLKAGSETDTSYWKRFCGNAQLEVTYNRPPLQPVQSQLGMTPGGVCEAGKATDHYVSRLPKVTAVIKDPDHGDLGSNTEKVRAQFKVWWTEGGTTVVKYAMTDFLSTRDVSDTITQTGQAVFSYSIGSDLTSDTYAGFKPSENVTVRWAVRGLDEKAVGPWSDEGTQTPCEFILDTTQPEPTVVTSPQYPDDDVWHTGVGDYGTFVMSSPSNDVVKFRYYFTGPNADNTVQEKTFAQGLPLAVIDWMPPSEGPYVLHVTAIDGAGKAQKGGATDHAFQVGDGRAPVAAWSLGDAAGSAKAAGSSGSPDAAAGSGVTFGVQGPRGSTDSAASLDGTANGYLDAGRRAVDTSGTFSVSAWVKMPSLPTQDVTVVSQDGTAQPGFDLGYDAESASWSFAIPLSDMESLGSWRVTGASAVPDSWTHLIGVYDAKTGMMMLYVNGALAAADVQPRQTAWSADGALQIGRQLALDGYTGYFKGSVADVKVHDRVIPQAEGQDLGGIQPSQLAYWEVDEAQAGVSPEAKGAAGPGLTLGGGATIYQLDDSCDPVDPDCTPAKPLAGAGHLQLNGTDAYAARAAGLLPAKDSFTLTARARLASTTSTAHQTVLSLSGAKGSAVKVKYLPSTTSGTSGKWQLVVTDADSTTPVITTALDSGLPKAEGDGNHLGLVYNAVFREVVLYVDGEPKAEAPWTPTWDFKTTGLQVGRTLTGTTASEYFSGAVDEVRMYQGPLDAALVLMVATIPAGSSIEEPTSA